SGCRQHAGRRSGAGRDHLDAHPRGIRGRRLRRDRLCLDRPMVARRPIGRRLDVRARRSRPTREAGRARRRVGLRGRALFARAPGGPTHVLLDDRVAEHVPGCNMAFRRDALLAIDGFNPIYLRAGDDVDVCWRLQARGWKIGFAPAALVWHHHRTSVNTYWKQQIGYGEGETWLMAHHPDKFLDGRMLWRGRIYSPLPFVRSLWSTRVNAGVWGTAACPSV